MMTVNPNGEPTTFAYCSYDEDWNATMLSDGNVIDDDMVKLIYLGEDLILSVSSNAGSVGVVPGPKGAFNPQDNRNFYVNKVSDRYTFRVCHLMSSYPAMSGGAYLAVTQAKGGVEGTYTNSPEYILEDSRLAHTPAASEYPISSSIDGEVYPYNVTIIGEGADSGMSVSSIFPEMWNIWLSRPADEHSSDHLYCSYKKNLVDILVINEEYGYQSTYNVNGSSIFPFANDGVELCQFPSVLLGLNSKGSYPAVKYPGNLGFESILSTVQIEGGESAPLFSSLLRYEYDWAGGFYNYLYKYYTGRLGETLSADSYLAKESLKVNGEDVLEDNQSIATWMILNPEAEGSFEAEFATDNFTIDGMNGGNSAIVRFTKGGEDSYPPTATMLQLRDKEDNVSQIFSDPTDGTILLTAADIEVNYGNQNIDGWVPTYYTCSTPAKVTAAVAPTGVAAEMWEEIELTEDSELFYSPGFGAFYYGSLKSVTQTSPTGWFDLKLYVEDAAGNSQLQTISPAFKIESLTSGVAGVVTKKVKVEGNSIITESTAVIYNLNGQVVSGDNLPSGIYFVVFPEGTVKILI